MTNLRFESIWILSRKERAARWIPFHPGKTLIVGRNHTGKSSLIKTLFETLGASPTGKLEKWDPSVTSLLNFCINDTKYSLLKQGNYRLLRNITTGELIACSTRSEWTEVFSRISNFNLTVFNKKGGGEVAAKADPRCFFIPFYINQDGSWAGSWDTFQSIKQFTNPVPGILDYFSGLKPPEYYAINAEKKNLQSQLDEQEKEQGFLKKAWDRLGKNMEKMGPKLDEHNFRKEIDMLSAEVSELNEKQELIRENIVKERDLLFSIKQQIELSNRVLASYEEDSEYLQNNPSSLVCPLCHAEHHEPFLEILEYTEDARVLRDFVASLSDDLQSVQSRVLQSQDALNRITNNYRSVASLLETRRGDLQLKEVVSGMGAEQAFVAFEAEYTELKNLIEVKQLKMLALDQKLKALSSKERARKILGTFREAYEKSLRTLNLPPIDTSSLTLKNRPALSGSGGPRKILAYYNAIWAATFGEYGNFSVPIIIDSPNQQGQDDINLPAMLQFLVKDLPSNAQVIVASEIPTPVNFDLTHILPESQQYTFLSQKFFREVESVIEPLEQQLFFMLRSKDSASNDTPFLL